MQKWEYLAVHKIRNLKFSPLSNSMEEWTLVENVNQKQIGEDGWELVSAVSVSSLPEFPGITTEIDYLYKRLIE